jgi:predicted nucleic-acid-binding protein
MIALDTNVLVRYIMQDDAKQAALATQLVESLSGQSPGFLALVAVVELAWVLTSAYDLDRQQFSAALEGLLRSKEFIVERADIVWKALRLFNATNADFADCLISNSATSAGYETAMTFDRAAAKSAGMTLIV